MYFNALLRYYLHIEPETLTDEEWAQYIAYLEMIRQDEAKEKP